MPWDQISGNRPNKPQSPNDVASRPLPKSPVSSSLDNVVTQMIIRSPRVRPGKFVFGEAKRLLQQHRHKAGGRRQTPCFVDRSRGMAPAFAGATKLIERASTLTSSA